MRPTRGIAAGLLAGLTLCAGCSDWKAETYPASGRVTVNGKPPVGAVVHLHSLGEQPDVRNSRPWGKVKEDGTFTLSTYRIGDGAPAGEYAFTIVWPFEPDRPDPRDRLNFAYSTPEKSKWRFTITEGENELPPVEMTGVAVNSEPPRPSGQKGPPMHGGSPH